jgi:endonuclease-3
MKSFGQICKLIEFRLFFLIFAETLTMKKESRFAAVLKYFAEHVPDAATELTYRDGYQLAVAVVLSAQCTDKRVNLITPPFYERFPDMASLAAATPDEVLELIKSCSYPNNKTKNLINMAKVVQERFGGSLPSEVADLETIPGIGRKTANVLASVLFDKPAIAVDTHVFRVSERIGLTTGARNPRQTEEQLIRYIPAHQRAIAHHWLILHGRYVCTARNPKCSGCGISEFCRFFLTKKNT